MAILSDSNLDKSILYQDVSLTSNVDVNGGLKEPINSDALAQAIKIWLASAKGEKIRSSSGGWLIPLLSKPMNQETSDKIRENIIKGLSTEFDPPIEVVDIKVIPDKNKSRWLITVSGYNSSVNVGVNTYGVYNTTGATANYE